MKQCHYDENAFDRRRTLSTDLENDDVLMVDDGENAAAEPTAATTRMMKRVFMMAIYPAAICIALYCDLALVNPMTVQQQEGWSSSCCRLFVCRFTSSHSWLPSKHVDLQLQPFPGLVSRRCCHLEVF
jgi:hypothetical protein